MTDENWAVDTTAPEIELIEAGTYTGKVSRIQKIQTSYGEAALWLFEPDGMDVEVPAVTGLGSGNKTKAAEWTRRMQGLSTATDRKYGKDIKDKRPRVNWGPELAGTPCRFVVEVYATEDEDGNTVQRNKVANVLPPSTSLRDGQQQAAQVAQARTAEADEDVDDHRAF